MFDDEDGAVRLQKTRTATVSFSGEIEDLVKAICGAVPELNEKSFTVNAKRGTAEFLQLRAKKLLDAKVALELKIQKIADKKYHVTYEYRTKQFRLIFFLFVCLGLLFGLVPGLILYFMFRESDTTEVQKVMPMLDRFDALVGPVLDGHSEQNIHPSTIANDEPTESGNKDVIKQFEKLASLRDSGAIDDDEFTSLKSKLLE